MPRVWRKRTRYLGYGVLLFALFLYNPATLDVSLENLSPSENPKIEYTPPALNLPENSKLLAALPEVPRSVTITSISPYNSSYKPRFLARTKTGTLLELTAEELNAYNATARAQIWAVGIKTKFGIVAFYVNDEDSVRNHGQVIIYPVFANGSLPDPTKPISATFMRLWMRVGSTWYQNYITDNALYAANSVDLRQIMVATNTSGTLSLGWETTLTIQGFDFLINNTLLIENTFLNTVQFKHKVIPLGRSFDGMGWEYVVTQSSYYKNTDWELMYGTAANSTYKTQIKFSDYVDVTQTVPHHYNRSTLLTAHNHTMHTFDWDTLKDTGFTNALFRVEQFLLPTGTTEYVLRVGSYAVTNIPQNYAVLIDPYITITEDATRAFPYSVCRDSNNIPYVLALIGSTLKIFKGNTGNPTSWSNETVGDGIVKKNNAGSAYMVIGSYGGTETIWIARLDDDPDIVLDKSSIADFSFPSGNTITIDADTTQYGHVAMDYGENRLSVVYRRTNSITCMINSTDGGTTWSDPVDTWNFGANYVQSQGIAWDESYWHLIGSEEVAAGNVPMYSKRWSSGSGLQYWDGDSWETSTSADDGLSHGDQDWYSPSTHGKATANIIVFGRPYYSIENTRYSRDGGETWNNVPGMGYAHYGYAASFCIYTESGKEDDIVMFASNGDSSYNDVNNNTYDYSGNSWAGWELYSDTGDTSDNVRRFAGELKQGDNDWIGVAYEIEDDSASSYLLNFTTYQVGSAGGDSTSPSFTYDGTSTTNNTSVELGTSILANWSITEANPSVYIIYSNETGTGNVSRTSGAYNNGDYKSHTFSNTNASNVGLTLFFQIWANDTSQNSNSSTVYFDIVDTTDPVLAYDGTSTTNNSNIEYNSENALANWSVTELAPDYFYVWCNGTGTNTTVDSGSYANGDYLNYTYTNTNASNIGNVIFIQAWVNDTQGQTDTETAYFTVVETTGPSLSYDGTSTTNNSNIQFNVDNALANWSITEVNPDYYFVWSNATGTNSTKESGSYSNGEYVDWTYTNTNITNIGNVIFIQAWANDTAGNSATETAYFTVYEEAPEWAYDGGSTTNNSNVEYGNTILANWSLSDEDPDDYWVFGNETGTNVTKSSGTFTSGSYYSHSFTADNTSNIGKTVFVQIKCDDDGGYSNESIVYFNIVDTTDPSFSYSGDTNNTNLEYGTDFTANWTANEIDPDYHFIWSNATGTNVTKESGAYTNGQTLDWTYTNNNASNIGNVIFIQVWANDTSGNEETEIVYFTIIESIAPTFTYAGTTNNSQVHLGTNPIGNWSLSEPNIPDTYLIWSNSTGTNETKASGSYADGDYKSWTYTNTNESNADKTVFIQIYANDTQANSNTSIAYFQIYNDIPSWEYTGSTNNSNIEWESGGAFSASWTVSEGSPQFYYVFYNQSGSNTTYASGSYSDSESLTGTYDPGLSDVGHKIYFQLWLNDTYGNSNSSLVYFTVTNTDAPTVTISSPTNTTYTGGDISITLACSNADVDALWWALYFSNATLVQGNTTWTVTTSKSLNDSTYYLKAYANDTAGLEDSETVWFTLTTGAVVGAAGGSSAIYTTSPVELPTLPAPAVPTILYRTPVLLLIGAFVGGAYAVHRYLPEEVLKPEEEFQQFKREMRKDLLRAYYQARKKQKQRKK